MMNENQTDVERMKYGKRYSTDRLIANTESANN